MLNYHELYRTKGQQNKRAYEHEKRILTNKEYRFIKELKELMTKYNAVISTDAQGKIEIVVNEDNESFDFEAESTIYLGACFSDYELNELLEKNFAHIIRIKEEYKTNL